jgi:hypothetical protein
MPIEGPVRELAVSDLLQLVFLSRRTGRLFVKDEGTGRGVVLELENGALAGATGTGPEARLGRLLVGSGRATDAQIARALDDQRNNPDRRIGEILVANGAVRAAEVERHLRFQVEEAVFDLMRWQDGFLRFEEMPVSTGRSIEIRLPTDGVLMDAVRRLDEWAEVTATAPDPDPLPRLAAGGSGPGHPLTLAPPEWEVLAKVDGQTSLRKIALGLGRSELEVARAIFSLATAGVVEVTSRPAYGRGPESTEMDAEAGAIETDLAAGHLDEAERRVRQLLATRPGAAALHVLNGRVMAGRSDWPAAIGAFQRAIEIDPLLPTAYFHLARASVRNGDLSGAGRALGTYRRLPDGSLKRRGVAERMAAGLAQLVGGLEEAAE